MIIGHQKQWQFLKKSAELERLPHGILFCGEAQLGKKTLAIEFTKFLNCSLNDPENRPCQNCRSCRDIQKKIHPDFILIEPASSQGEIQISQIRNLINKLALRSYEAIFKVAIIDQAHLMNKEAQSCFLKLLEEPRGRTILILVTEYPEMLLPTIVSRVQKIKFFPVAKSEIENYIISQGVSRDQAEYFASISQDRPGVAMSFLLNSEILENQKKFVFDLIKIGKSGLSSRFQYAKDLLDKNDVPRETLKETLNTWTRYFRELLLSRIHYSAEKPKKEESFEYYSLRKLAKIISLIQSTNLLISSTNVNPKLALENLLIEL